jgi:hypothetical protein
MNIRVRLSGTPTHVRSLSSKRSSLSAAAVEVTTLKIIVPPVSGRKSMQLLQSERKGTAVEKHSHRTLFCTQIRSTQFISRRILGCGWKYVKCGRTRAVCQCSALCLDRFRLLLDISCRSLFQKLLDRPAEAGAPYAGIVAGRPVKGATAGVDSSAPLPTRKWASQEGKGGMDEKGSRGTPPSPPEGRRTSR